MCHAAVVVAIFVPSVCVSHKFWKVDCPLLKFRTSKQRRTVEAITTGPCVGRKMESAQDHLNAGELVSVSVEYLTNLQRNFRRSEARLAVALSYIKKCYGNGKIPKNLENDLRAAELAADVKNEKVGDTVDLVTVAGNVANKFNDNHDNPGIKDFESVGNDDHTLVCAALKSEAIEFEDVVQMETVLGLSNLPEDEQMDTEMNQNYENDFVQNDSNIPMGSPSSSLLVNSGQVRIVDIQSITEPPEDDQDQDIKILNQCSSCDAMFPSVHDLGMHALVHCQVEMNDSGSQRIDSSGARRQPPRKSKEKALKADTLLKPKSQLKICNECGFMSRYFKDLKLHIESEHQTNPSLQCKVCKFYAKSPHQLQKHNELVHAVPNPELQCGHCKFEAKSAFQLRKHIELQHSDASPAYHCNRCDLGFKSEAKFNKHISKTHVRTKKTISTVASPKPKPLSKLLKFKCEDCGTCFKTSIHLNCHRRSAHIDIKPPQPSRPSILRKSKVITCEVNPYDVLKEHIPAPRPISEYKCVTCSTSFKLKTELNMHRKNEHGENLFCCHICGFAANSEGRLNYHRRWTHPPPEPCAKSDYRCPNCDCFYKSEQDLKTHILDELHSPPGLMPVRCKDCGQMCPSLELLRTHQLIVHPVPAPAPVQPQPAATPVLAPAPPPPPDFRCPNRGCRSRFESRINLNLHRKKVHKDKSFFCHSCKFEANTERKLSLHTKKVHPQSVDPNARPFKCPHCPLDFKSRERYRRHTNRHLGKDMRKCPHCGVMKNGTDIYNHITIVHKGRKYKCKYCPSMFSLRAHLRNHYVLKHVDEPMPPLTEFEVIYTLEAGDKTSTENSEAISALSNDEDLSVEVEAPKPRTRKLKKVSKIKTTSTKPKRWQGRLTCSTCDVRLHSKDEFDLHMMRHAKDPNYKLKHRIPVKLIEGVVRELGPQRAQRKNQKKPEDEDKNIPDLGDDLNFQHFLNSLI